MEGKGRENYYQGLNFESLVWYRVERTKISTGGSKKRKGWGEDAQAGKKGGGLLLMLSTNNGCKEDQIKSTMAADGEDLPRVSKL